MKRSLTGFLFVVLSGLANGQTFDVASLKPDNGTFVRGVTGRMNGGPGTGDPGRIAYTQVGILELVMKVWDAQMYQISGPAWLKERGQPYTIAATMPTDTTKEKFHLMLQNLLIERFRMKLHHETRNLSGYELVVAPGGSKLKETAQDPDAPELPPPSGIGKDGFSLLPPGHAGGVVMANGGTHFKCQSYTIAEFIRYLGGFINQSGGDGSGPLIDKTGLNAKYDFTLEFDARGAAARVMVGRNVETPADHGDAPATAGTLDPGSGFPKLFTALEKQLGLRLVKANVPVDVVVIDQMEKVPLGN
jgi:uncharacterized protein (TIGR03435 family)